MPRLPDLTGPMPALPAAVDALGRRWAATSGRVRLLVRVTAVVVLLVAAAGGLVRGPWGPPTSVLVSTDPMSPGDRVTTADVTMQTRPSDLVPADALTDPDQLPNDARAAGALSAGAVLTTSTLHPEGAGALATPGTAVVAVDAQLLPPLPSGTRLDVAVPGHDGTAVLAARDAEVVADDGTWRWLRVAREDVAALAVGVSEGRLVVAVLPP